MMARYYSYHHYYTGLTPTQFSMPLVFGSEVHSALEYVLIHLRDNNNKITDNEIRSCIEQAKTSYLDQLDSCEWTNFSGTENRIDYIADEQTTLLEGLVWCWVLQLMSWIQDNYKIVAVEQEFERSLACNCGLGNTGSIHNHKDRGCYGVILMTRPDIILQNIKTDNLEYIEFKTGSYVSSDNYPDQFYNNIQFIVGASAVEHVKEQDVTQLWVHGLHKGTRRLDESDATKKQNSILCYAYVRPSSPPLTSFDISAEYYKTLPDGKRWGCSPKRGYTKTPIWKIAFPSKDLAQSSIEHYVKNVMTPEQRASQVRLIGPIGNSRFLADKMLNQMVHEEQRWVDRLAYIEEAVLKSGDWESTATIEAIEEVIPRSWNCVKYGEEHMCTYTNRCHEKTVGKMIDDDHYVTRDPNHPIEKELSEFYKKGAEGL